MIQTIKKCVFSALVLGLCFSVTACGDDEKEAYETPDIFTYVDAMWQAFGEAEDCTTIKSGIARLSTEQYKTQREMACSNYRNALNTAGSTKKLTENQTNSGYYLSAYILSERMHKKAIGCDPGTSPEFEKLFNAPGCEEFLTVATSITNGRGR